MPRSSDLDLAPLPRCPWARWRCPLASDSCSLPQSEDCILLELVRVGRHRPDGRAPVADGGPWSQLSRRETQVAEELLRGSGPSEIARALHISPHTARNHLKSILRKLGVHSQAALVTVLSRRE